MRLGGIGDNPRKGRLSGTGRAIENKAGELVNLDCPAQQPAMADNMLLTVKIIQREWTYAVRKRGIFLGDSFSVLVKYIHSKNKKTI